MEFSTTNGWWVSDFVDQTSSLSAMPFSWPVNVLFGYKSTVDPPEESIDYLVPNIVLSSPFKVNWIIELPCSQVLKMEMNQAF